MDLQEIYKALRSEYNGKTWSDEFLKTHIDLRGDQIICWFEIEEDEGDEGFEEKRDCTISFYDEVVRFLVDNFGEEFKYEDPRISDDYIDKNNFHGQYEIVLDDDGESPAVIAIWENEENKMKTRFNENKFGKLAKEAGRKVIPAANGCSIHDMYDCWIVTNKNGLNIGQCKTLIEAKHIAENADEYTARKLGYSESKKIVKEGAGAGYDVGISDLEIDKVTEVKELEDGDYAFTATIKPGFYEISAESYYDDFFWQEHEFGDTPEAKIDGGVIHGTICTWEDTEDPEEWVRYQVEGSTFNISFMYGGGWMHVNLPEDGQLYIDKHIEITPEPYFSVDDIQLDAIDLVQAVNCGYASLDDRDNDEEEDEENVNEATHYIDSDKGQADFNALVDAIQSCPDFKVTSKGNGIYSVSFARGFKYGGSLKNNDGWKVAKHIEEVVGKDMFNLRDGNYSVFDRNVELDANDFLSAYDMQRINESYDDKWQTVTAGYDEFVQRLWEYTRKDMKNRRDAFSRCTNAMEKALREYYNEVVYDGAD